MLSRCELPSASSPGTSVSPSVLTAKITMSTMIGTRIRRSTRKIPVEGRRTSTGDESLTGQRRWKETVSTTSSTTETMFANNAPPDSETTAAVVCASSPPEAISEP